MTNKAARYITLSQLSLFAFLAICTAIMPKFLTERDEGGLSNYGIHRATVVPYTLAFLLSGILILQATRFTPNTKTANHLRAALYVLAGVLFFVLLTTYPYKINATYDNLHLLSGILIFWTEMAIACWAALVLRKDRVNLLLLAVQAFGFIMAILNFFGVIHLLFIIQAVTSLAFGALLIRTSQQIFQTDKGNYRKQN